MNSILHKYYESLDWFTIKLTTCMYLVLNILSQFDSSFDIITDVLYKYIENIEKYDHIINLITKDMGYLSIFLGTCTVAIRFVRTLFPKKDKRNIDRDE